MNNITTTSPIPFSKEGSVLFNYSTLILDLDGTIWNCFSPSGDSIGAYQTTPPYTLIDKNIVKDVNGCIITLQPFVKDMLESVYDSDSNIGIVSSGEKLSGGVSIPFEAQPSVMLLRKFNIYKYFNYDIILKATDDKGKYIKTQGKTLFIGAKIENLQNLDKPELDVLGRNFFRSWDQLFQPSKQSSLNSRLNFDFSTAGDFESKCIGESSNICRYNKNYGYRSFYNSVIERIRKHKSWYSEDSQGGRKIATKEFSNPRLGQCYVLSWRFVTTHNDWKLIHGNITNRDHTKTIDHAWCENQFEVFDPVLDWTLPKGAYYGVFNAEKLHEFTREEASNNGVKYGTYGPWDDIRNEGITSSMKLSFDFDAIEDDYTEEYTDGYGDLKRKNDKGQFHSLFSPAVEYLNGDKEWYLNDKLHREDGPAREYANGDKHWYKDGKRHREDGPAVEDANGNKRWYQNGKLHREDGPAVEDADGSKAWYYEGKSHREDGPAVEYSNGDKEWYLNDKFYGSSTNGYTQEQFEEDLRRNGITSSMKQEKDNLFICLWAPQKVYKKLSHIENLDSELHITLIYRKDVQHSKELTNSLLDSIGRVVREIGKIECESTGIGSFDNEDSSNVILVNCVKGVELYNNLVQVVTDIYGDWEKSYGFIPHMTIKYEGTGETKLKDFRKFSWDVEHIGVRLGDNNFLVDTKTGKWVGTKKILSSQKLSFDMSAFDNDYVKEYVDEDGDLVRIDKDEKYHSLYSPAVEYPNGTNEWWQNGKLHRLDGPAIEYYSGNKSWYYKGKFYGKSINGYTQEQFEEDLRGEGIISSQHLSFDMSAFDEDDYVKEYIDEDGTIRRRNEKGEFHSLYSPAIEDSNGYKAWYRNGKRHREDGPAIEFSDGDKEWYYDGKFYGKLSYGYNQEKFEAKLRSLGKIASQKFLFDMSVLKDDFVKEVISKEGTIFRYNKDDEYHSLHSPAIEYTDGFNVWYVNGKCYGSSNTSYSQEQFESDLKNIQFSSFEFEYPDTDLSPADPLTSQPSTKGEEESSSNILDFNYEKTIFEKGLHQQINEKNDFRPITPYGRKKLSFDSTPSFEVTVEDQNFVYPKTDSNSNRTNPKRQDQTSDWYNSVNEHLHDSDISNRTDNTIGLLASIEN